MDFQPKTAQQIEADKLPFPVGTYDFQVMDATEKASKRSGSQMIELSLRVTDGNGQFRIVTDWLVVTQIEKVRRAALACGLYYKYETGSLSDRDFRGLRGRLRLGIEKGKGKYPDRNMVLDYVV